MKIEGATILQFQKQLTIFLRFLNKKKKYFVFKTLTFDVDYKEKYSKNFIQLINF